MKKILFILILILSFVLRFYKLGENPPALYWDEASLGYNAYSISTSGYDEHGEKLPLARFIAYGDYKPPGYIYSAVLPIRFFGLNDFSIRFPSAISGFLMVFVTYFLVNRLFASTKIALLSSFILGVSPWAVHFSRAAFEANLAAFFNLAGIFFFISQPRKRWFILPSMIFFVLSFYTFNANRIIAPLIILSLFIIYFKTIRINLLWLIISTITAVFLIFPSIGYLGSRESRLRFQEVSIFTSQKQIITSNERISLDGDTIISRIIHNRRVIFLVDFLKHYTDNFSLRFLFTHGDINPRLSSQAMGQLYIWEFPFLFLGIWFLIRKRDKTSLLIVIWMLIVPVPAGMARETPHALRILSILPTYQIIIASGLFLMLRWVKNASYNIGKYSISVILSFICFFNFYYYLHDYYVHYPLTWAGQWQYGYKQMVDYVLKISDRYEKIYVTDALGRPYIYFALGKPYNFQEFQKHKKADRDWYGFWNVESLGKITFSSNAVVSQGGKVLAVTAGDIPAGFRLMTTIHDPLGKKVFNISESI